MLSPIADAIPEQLKALPRFAQWRGVPNGAGKVRKLPYISGTNRLAKCNDPTTWGPFTAASATFPHDGGVLIALGETSPGKMLAAMDLDNCREPESGELQQWAQELLDDLRAYAEVSPSGTGVHALFFSAPFKSCKRDGIELYSCRRFLTITGRHLPGTSNTIEDRSEQIAALLVRLNGKAGSGAPSPESNPSANAPTEADEIIISRIRQDPLGFDLWAGSWKGKVPTHSEADWRLCCLIIRNGSRDPKQIDRIFRRSTLRRPKWNTRRGADGITYGQVTIEKALAAVRSSDGAGQSRCPGLDELEPGASSEEVERVMRSIQKSLEGADGLRRAIIRDDIIRRLKVIGISSAARLADLATTYQPDSRKDSLTTEDEPWSDAVDGVHALNAVARLIGKYIVISKFTADAIALWIFHTYLMAVWKLSPILLITSPTKRCGKTTLLSLIGSLVSRPIVASSLTGAVIFRLIEREPATLVLDEADGWLTDEKSELRSIINGSHLRTTAYVMRCEGDNHLVCRYSTWSAKAIAMIRQPSDTIVDRSIVASLQRKLPGDFVQRLRITRIAEETADIRRQMRRWAEDHADQLGNADPELPRELDDRAVDNWEPLFAIADAVGGHWPSRARAAAAALSACRATNESLGITLLGDIRAIISAEPQRFALNGYVPSSELVSDLVQLTDKPWPECSNGKPLSPNKLARLLGDFGIFPVPYRDGSQTKRGYRLVVLQQACERYAEQPQQRNNRKEDGPQHANTEPEQSAQPHGEEAAGTASKTSLNYGVADIQDIPNLW